MLRFVSASVRCLLRVKAFSNNPGLQTKKRPMTPLGWIHPRRCCAAVGIFAPMGE